MKDELKVIKQKPNEELIDMLENLLKVAKEGELQGALFVKAWSNDTFGHGYCVTSKHLAPALIGEMYMAMNDLSVHIDGVDHEAINWGT